jgi:serine/threonine protein kinase
MKYIGNYYIKDKKYFGKGAFSKIYKGYNKYTNAIVAIKQIKVEDINKLKIYVKREIDLHSKLNHENIVKVYDIVFDEFNNYIYMVLEYCENGDLYKYQNKKRMNEIYIQNFFFQLKNGLKYLRDNNIIHRDLKPQNLLITNHNTLKISDFGLAKEFKTEDTPTDLNQTYCGSPLYMSPELMQHKKYSSSTDLWSIGIILYELITGENPFKVKNYNQLLKKIKQPVKLPTKYRKTISPECYHLLNKLLNKDSKERISWEDFFQHAWLKDNKLTEYHNSLIKNPLQYSNIDNLPPLFIEEKYEKIKPIINQFNTKLTDKPENIKITETKILVKKNQKNQKNKIDDINSTQSVDTNIINNTLITSNNYSSDKNNKIIDTYNLSNDNNELNNSYNKTDTNSTSSDIYLSTNEMINGMEIYDSDTNPLENSDTNPLDDSDTNPLENSDTDPLENSYIDPLENSYIDPLENSYTDPLENNNSKYQIELNEKYHKKRKNETIENNQNETNDFVKIDLNPQNDIIFTTSLMSSNEASKPINITRTYNFNSNNRGENRKYDFHSEIENSVQEKIKRDTLSPNKSSIESILNSSLNIIKESYSYISNSNSHKSL